MVRSATLTTVPSSIVMPEPRTAAATTARPVAVPSRTPPDPATSLTPNTESGPRSPMKAALCPPRILQWRRRPSPSARLADHVDRLGLEHPPIDLASVDFTVRRPDEFNARFGHVLDYMARVELEVDRNVLELTTLLPDPPEIDRRFYAEVWQPQEIQHGLILDELQVQLGRPAAEPDLTSIGVKMRILGALAHLDAVPGRLPDALLPDRHGHRALRGARLQPAPRRRRRHGRGRRSPRR